MRTATLIPAIGVPSLCLAVVLSVFSPALADGLKSQWKNRIPQGAPVTDTFTSGTITEPFTVRGLSARQQETIASIVRRNLRAEQRREKWFGEEGKMNVASNASVSAVNTGNRAPKERFVSKGNQWNPSRCDGLHTHDRSVCLNEIQLKGMVRMEESR